MLKISNNPTLSGLCVLKPGITYSSIHGCDITLDLIVPQTPDEKKTFPLIVFIQGSAWTTPDTNYQLAQLSALSAEGFVIASIRHRSIADGYPAPAYLVDAKTAVRYLKSNASLYHIDPDKVYAFGTSSGGNTALLLGLTGDIEKYKTEEYPDVSDSVNGVIDCFGPADLFTLVKETSKETSDKFDGNNALAAFCGGKPDEQLLKDMSPVYYVEKGKSYVPFLIAHGDADPVVSFSQSSNLAQKLEECGADVSLICVEHAEHEGTFWSRELWQIIAGFLKRISK